MGAELDDLLKSDFDIEERKVLAVRESLSESVFQHTTLLDSASPSREGHNCL